MDERGYELPGSSEEVTPEEVEELEEEAVQPAEEPAPEKTKAEYIEDFIEGPPKKKETLFSFPEALKPKKNELSELFEKPSYDDPDINTDDLFEIEEEDIMGDDFDEVLEVDEEQIMGGDISDLTEVSEGYVMGYKKKKKPKKKRYQLPPGMGGLRQ